MKRTSITLEDSIYEAGQQIAAKRGFSQSFSGYVAWLVQRDAEGGVSREETPSLTQTKTRGIKPAAVTRRRATRRGTKRK
ncbi:MAG: hypothetical protein ACFUZC_16945 [Chthoniobacteraceae bacterium]